MTLQILLPIGISFYTLQTISYTVDAHRREIPAERNLIDFALFVASFPQLVAGPIHLASDMFMLRFYGDFAGYTDIARGTARLLGVELVPNFEQPLFFRSFTEFWQRWHITLSTWLGDYLFQPLRRRWRSPVGAGAAIIVTMSLAGLWHGATTVFLLWGLANGLFLVGERLGPWRVPTAADPYRPSDVIRNVIVFRIAGLAFVLIQMGTVGGAVAYWSQMLSFAPGRPTRWSRSLTRSAGSPRSVSTMRPGPTRARSSLGCAGWRLRLLTTRWSGGAIAGRTPTSWYARSRTPVSRQGSSSAAAQNTAPAHDAGSAERTDVVDSSLLERSTCRAGHRRGWCVTYATSSSGTNNWRSRPFDSLWIIGFRVRSQAKVATPA